MESSDEDQNPGDLERRDDDLGVSLNGGTPKSSILIGFSIIINHPFWGIPIFWKHPFGETQNKTVWWWQLKDFLFSPQNLGKMNPCGRQYF